MVLYKKRITVALTRLRRCAGWYAPLLFAILQRQVFSRRGQYVTSEGSGETAHQLSNGICTKIMCWLNYVITRFLRHNNVLLKEITIVTVLQLKKKTTTHTLAKV